MIDGLTMTADQIQAAGVALQRYRKCFGIRLAQAPIQSRQLCRRDRISIHGRQHRAAQCRRKREAGVTEQF